MTDYHIGTHKSINEFVLEKLASFREKGFRFDVMFELMFREESNVLYEQSEGYRIKKTTYGEAKAKILRRAASLSCALSDLPHDAVVGLYLDNSLEWIELFWAILAAGFRPLLMNLRLPHVLLLGAMNACGCRAVVGNVDSFPCPVLRPGDVGFDGDPIDPVPFGTELLVMSSGTTEHVKVCAYSAEEFYHQISDSFEIIKAYPQIKKHYEGNLKLLAFLPFYHVFGLIAMYIWFGFFSRTFVHLADLSPQTIVNTIRRHKVTHVFAVPLFWEKVYEQAMKGIEDRGEKTAKKFNRALALWEKLPAPLCKAFSKAAFREVRENLFGESVLFMISGGSFLDPKVLSFFNGIGYRLVNGYGMTEIGITSVELSENRKYLRGGSIGKPMKSVEYRIDENGELLVKGQVLAKYVLSGGVKTDRDGWFHTRDLAASDNGHFRVLGRADDLIVGPDGENLNPNLIEPLLKSEKTEVCLIPASENGRVVPVLLVGVNRRATDEALSEIRNDLTERIERAGLTGAIARVVVTGEKLMLPDEFKLNRVRLSRAYAEGKLKPIEATKTADSEALDARTEQIRSIFAAALGRDESEIGPDANFFLDLGGTSLDYFAMLTRLRDTFGAPFPIERADLRTVREITAYLEEQDGGNA